MPVVRASLIATLPLALAVQCPGPDDTPTPMPITPPCALSDGSCFAWVAAGDDHTLAAWAKNPSGQLGLGHASPSPSPGMPRAGSSPGARTSRASWGMARS